MAHIFYGCGIRIFSFLCMDIGPLTFAIASCHYNFFCWIEAFIFEIFLDFCAHSLEQGLLHLRGHTNKLWSNIFFLSQPEGNLL
jgi:hypothetical protein